LEFSEISGFKAENLHKISSFGSIINYFTIKVNLDTSFNVKKFRKITTRFQIPRSFLEIHRKSLFKDLKPDFINFLNVSKVDFYVF
jgi:hypothetical protein